MSVKQQMIGILTSGEAARIAFSFRGSNGATISIDRTTFTRVANALQSGSIAVVENRFPGDIAMYSSRADPAGGYDANTFYLGRNKRYSRLFNALICHESVHASFDLTSSSLPWIDNEAAAYIAQAFYARNSGLSIEAFELGSESRVAYYAVNELRQGNAANIEFFIDELRNSLRSNPMYHGYINGNFAGDG